MTAVHIVEEPVPVEEIGGIRAARRPVPAWLILAATAIMAVATWYILSFSSTSYTGGYPRPDVPRLSVPLTGPGGPAAPRH